MDLLGKPLLTGWWASLSLLLLRLTDGFSVITIFYYSSIIANAFYLELWSIAAPIWNWNSTPSRSSGKCTVAPRYAVLAN